MKDTAIQVNNLKKQFEKTHALSSVSFGIGKGEMFGLIGPDGAGKTTLIRILTSLLDPDEGECFLFDISVQENPSRVRNMIGYMPQRFSLYPDLTVGENLRFFADLFNVSKNERTRKTEDLLEFSRLKPFIKRKAGDLSGGMKQKLALSCALIHTPDILVLDEPTTGVDPVSRREFWSILTMLKNDGVTILVTTPYMDEAERCDRVALIHHGEILAMGSSSELIETFSGAVFSIFGPDLVGLSVWFKKELRSDQVRIMGDRVKLNLLSSKEIRIDTLVENAKASGQTIHSFDREVPELEDTFITLISEKEKANAPNSLSG